MAGRATPTTRACPRRRHVFPCARSACHGAPNLLRPSMIAASFGGTIVDMGRAKAVLMLGLGLASGMAGACSKSSSSGEDAGGLGGAPGTGGEWAAGGRSEEDTSELQ